MNETRKLHRHEFVFGQENITCQKCGKSIPLVEEETATAQSLILNGYIEKIGGIAGKNLYFRPIEKVFETFHWKQLEIRDEENKLERAHGVESIRDIRLVVRTNVKMYSDLERIEISNMSKWISCNLLPIAFLRMATDDLINKYFDIERKQREWKGVFGFFEIPRFSFDEDVGNLQCARMEVRAGRITSLEFGKYSGPVQSLEGGTFDEFKELLLMEAKQAGDEAPKRARIARAWH